MKTARQINPRTIVFILFSAVIFIFSFTRLRELFALSLNDELYSHIPVIPVISAYLIYSDRKKIFADAEYSLIAGGLLILAGIILYLSGMSQGVRLSRNDLLAVMTSSFVVMWIGLFVMCYGNAAMKMAAFPLLFLIFMIPLPDVIVKGVISALQVGSTEVSYKIFEITGVPVFRDGFIFYLPGLSVEVAEQCSGIRSSIALFLVSLLAGHIFLRTKSRKVILSLLVFPITVFKNSLRIVTLTLLGAYVDVRILSSELHKSGGIPFFIVSVSLLMAVLWILRRTERARFSSQSRAL